MEIVAKLKKLSYMKILRAKHNLNANFDFADIHTFTE